ncbi:PTS transporter subunit EIIC [uncultured Limosilactobacillus sp.]|uniref:PTS transporter subunit EIIC n=1 Tax=uncultured Limosilactobacillus sp. TaxID=2837629 RepID=UPI0025E89679|nr:PTS transporter subunit EIIC [uncultured Limosilactobacillus sp.]
MFDQERWIEWMVRFRRRAFIQILHRTLITLFPLILIGSFSWLLYENLLSTNGFLGSVLHVTQWLPFREFLRNLFMGMTKVTVGWTAPFACLISAWMTTKYYHQENPLAGVTAIVCYTLIFVHSVQGNNDAIETRYYTAAWLIIGVIIGYLVGRVFVRFGRSEALMDFTEPNVKVIRTVLINLKPMTILVGGAFILHVLFGLVRQFGLDGMVSQWISSALDRNSNYFLNIILSVVNTVLVWCGFAEPLTATSQVYNNEMAANLGYALTHKTPWGIPYPFTPSSLYMGFAVFGGVGLTLALILGVLWSSRSHYYRQIARWSMAPGIFNIGLPILFGAQVFCNPVYLLPFVVLPVVNIILGSCFIFIHAIPPLVYPVPNGTPGILTPFIATGGNWVAFAVTMVLLIVDVILYIPFVKLVEKVEARARQQLGEDSQHENH